jgi:hypothetical protein
MSSVLAWIGAVVGALLLLFTSRDIVGTLVVPRGFNARLSGLVSAMVRQTYRAICRPVKRYETRDRMLAWAGPTQLLARLVVWVILLLVGFALLLLPATHDSLNHALDEAGSSLFTVGSFPPTDGASTVIDYVAAYSGLIVVALQIGYLPTIYSAFNRREAEVTLLVARAGSPAWGPELLLRTRYGIPDGDVHVVLNELFDRWERWSAELTESHTTYPTLIWLRSPRSWSHWLIAQLAILDAAALHLSLAPSAEPRLPARLCLRMGFTALRQIGAAMNLPIDEDPDPDLPIALTFEEFERAVAQLELVGYPLEATAEEAWPHFRGWRANYEAVAYAIAYAVDAPPALWSGTRRWKSEPVAPGRPSNRISKDAPTQPRA